MNRIRIVREKLGKAEFIIAKSVLGLVYMQALIWLAQYSIQYSDDLGSLTYKGLGLEWTLSRLCMMSPTPMQNLKKLVFFHVSLEQ